MGGPASALRFIARCKVSVDPFSPHARTGRFFLNAVSTPAAIEANPNLKAEVEVHNRRTPSTVSVTYTDGVEEQYAGDEMSGQQVLAAIEARGPTLELKRTETMKWAKEETVERLTLAQIDAMIEGKGRRHKPPKEQKAAMRLQFADDVEYWKGQLKAEHRKKSDTIRARNEGLGIDHF